MPRCCAAARPQGAYSFDDVRGMPSQRLWAAPTTSTLKLRVWRVMYLVERRLAQVEGGRLVMRLVKKSGRRAGVHMCFNNCGAFE